MGVALAFLFYMAALGFGYALSGSVVEEKANRIVEIITTKIPVRQLLIGKIAGNTLLAIGQTALIVAVGLIGISFTDYARTSPALPRGSAGSSRSSSSGSASSPAGGRSPEPWRAGPRTCRPRPRRCRSS